MKHVTRSVCVLLFVTLLIGCKKESGTPDPPPAKTPTLTTTTRAPEKTPAPDVKAPGAALKALPPLKQVQVAAPPVLEGALLTVVFGDVPKLIDQVGAVANQIMPNMNAEGLRRMFGMRFNDAELKILPPGGSFAFVVMPPVPPSDEPTPFGVVQVASAAAAAPYMETLSRGRNKCEVIDNMLIFSENDRGIAAAKSSLSAVKSQLFASVKSPGIEAGVNLPLIMSTWNDEILQFMEMMPAMVVSQLAGAPGGQMTPEMIEGIKKFYEAEFGVFYSLASQTQLFKANLAFDDTGFLVGYSVYPRSNTNLAAALGAPSLPYPEDLQSLLPGKAAFRVAGSTNMEAYTDFVVREARTVMERMKVEPETQAMFLNHIENSSKFNSGEYAYDLLVPGQQLFSGSIVLRSKGSADDMLSFLENAQGELDKAGISEMLKGLGVQLAMKLERDAKQHGGAKIHRFGVTLDIEKMPPEAKELMKKMMGDIQLEMAFLDDKALITLGPQQRIEELIDAVKAKRHPTAKPLAARQTLGPGGQQYMDLDLGAYMKLIADFASIVIPQGQENPIQRVASMFDNVEPITYAVRCENATLTMNMHIKASAIATIGQGIYKMVREETAKLSNRARNRPQRTRPGTAPGITGVAPQAAINLNDPNSIAGGTMQVKIDLRTLATALEAYRVVNGKYPQTLSEVVQPVQYIPQLPPDPFLPSGGTYQYRVSGESWTLWSVGPDQVDNQAGVEYNVGNGSVSAGDIIRAKK